MKRHWDALLGLLWVHVCLVTGMKVEQSPSALSLQEGASSILKCNYSSAVSSVQWFRQNPGGGSLTRLFYIASGMKQSGRLNCTLNAKERFTTYLCAVEAQCSLVICSLAPKLPLGLQHQHFPGEGICPHSSLCSFTISAFSYNTFFLLILGASVLLFHLLSLPFFFPEKLFVVTEPATLPRTPALH
uniref:Ig-like domain-containing protein n=1 Tax=Canis lupus familiaris TaxID=9615 RepID=A0A8C0R998_CANLF